MDKVVKHQLVEELQQVFATASIVIVTQNCGMTVKDSNLLRRKIKQSNGSFKVAKNSLVKIALKNSKYESLIDLMSGPTAISYSNDPVTISKVIDTFIKTNIKLKISGGVMGDTFLTSSQIKQLADLPSLDQLRGKIIGLLQAPASKIAAVLQAPSTKLVRVMDAHAKKVTN